MARHMAPESVARLADRLHCSRQLVEDLLRLAGGDESIVIEASRAESGIESVKAHIIDARIARVEE